MRLLELEPKFIKYQQEGDKIFLPFVERIEDAQGVEFLCPKCFAENKGLIGTHAVICWSRSRGVPEDAQPKPGRWTLEGTGLHDLTLNGDAIGGGGARSVLLLGGCAWHGFINSGEVTL